MRLLKFLGWSIVGCILLVGLVYGFLPTIGRMLITQNLTNHGFTNIEITIDRPGIEALTIPSLAFRTPPESGATSISIDNIAITYSFDSLLNNVVETVTIEHMKIVWDSSILDRTSSPLPSSPATQTNSQFALSSLGSGVPLPVLPFQHFRVNQVDISNPWAPPTLQQISLNANMDALPEGYAGFIHLEGDRLLLNRLTFSLTPSGTVSFTGTHTSAPEDRVLALKTSLERSTSGWALHGQAALKLHPFIHTLSALYPLPAEYQTVTGTFSGSWTGVIYEQPSQSDPSVGPIRGDFTLEARMPTWPPFAQDIQLHTQGTFSTEGRNMTVSLQPSPSGSINLSLHALTPPTLNPFISHKGPRSFAWNIRQPIQVLVPIEKNLHSIQVTKGQIQIAMRNATEQLEMILSPQDLRWQPASGLEGKGEVSISTQLKPAATPSLTLETLSLEAHAAFTLAADQIDVTLNPLTILRISNMQNETMQIPAMESRFPKGLTWTYHTGSQSWELQATASTLDIPSFSLQGQQWQLGDILTKNLMMTSIPERWLIHAETMVTHMRPPTDSFIIPVSDWFARYSVNPTALRIQFNGQTPGHPLQVGGQIKLNLLSGEGSGTMTLNPIQFAPQALTLSRLIQPWPFPEMDVTHGTISASAAVTFGKDSTNATTPFHLKRLQGSVDFKDISGFVKPTIMEGLTTRVEILGERDTFRIPPTPIHIRHIHSAVDLTDTSFILSSKTFPQTSPPILSIANAASHLLGGRISLSEAWIDPSATTHDLNLQVHGLDLGEILRLEQQETVKGTGSLDGALPLFISGSEVEVHHGSLQARPPGGTLQMDVSEATAGSWARSQPNLDLIVQSLQNFHYSQLDVGVDYEKNGILKLATQLKGKNPDYRNGLPIHFNLNIEENIPALMKSLSLVKGLEDKIEKMMTGRGKSAAK